ncbi:MAG: aquaporin [Defluviitaleaceae bacterium]|nr:aquaporin [Defluviitaleaceae bacterium]
MSGVRKYSAELFGTFVLVLVGCGAAMFYGFAPDYGHLHIALAFGLAVMAMAYAVGGVSGCHLNPAVSLSMLLDKRMNVSDFIAYIVAQVAGAIAAVAVLSFFVSQGVHDRTGGFAANGVGAICDFTVAGALAIEIILTAIFVFVILSITANEKMSRIAGLIIGLTLTAMILIGLPLTGVSVNPARSIGPAVFAGGTAMSELWIFIVGPLVGAVIAFVLFRVICGKKAEA